MSSFADGFGKGVSIGGSLIGLRRQKEQDRLDEEYRQAQLGMAQERQGWAREEHSWAGDQHKQRMDLGELDIKIRNQTIAANAMANEDARLTLDARKDGGYYKSTVDEQLARTRQQVILADKAEHEFSQLKLEDAATALGRMIETEDGQPAKGSDFLSRGASVGALRGIFRSNEALGEQAWGPGRHYVSHTFDPKTNRVTVVLMNDKTGTIGPQNVSADDKDTDVVTLDADELMAELYAGAQQYGGVSSRKEQGKIAAARSLVDSSLPVQQALAREEGAAAAGQRAREESGVLGTAAAGVQRRAEELTARGQQAMAAYTENYARMSPEERKLALGAAMKYFEEAKVATDGQEAYEQGRDTRAEQAGQYDADAQRARNEREWRADRMKAAQRAFGADANEAIYALESGGLRITAPPKLDTSAEKSRKEAMDDWFTDVASQLAIQAAGGSKYVKTADVNATRARLRSSLRTIDPTVLEEHGVSPDIDNWDQQDADMALSFIERYARRDEDGRLVFMLPRDAGRK